MMLNTEEINKRTEWVDILKGIGIFLVVLGHNQVSNYLENYIYSFHMPLFFLISGYLYNTKKYNRFPFFIKSRFKTIIIPYLIFSFISLIASVGRNVFQPFEMNWYKITYQFIIQGTIESNLSLWFLRTLFIVEISYYLLRKHIKNDLTLAMCLIVSLVTSFNSDLLGIPHEIVLWFNGLFFYGIGNILINKKINITKNNAKYVLALIIILVHNLIIFKCTKENIKLSISSTSYFISFILASTSGIITIYILSKFIKRCRILEYMGKKSLTILCTHILVKDVISIILKHILKIPKHSLVEESNFTALLMTITILLLSVPLIEIIYKHFPIILGKSKNKKHVVAGDVQL